MDDGRVAWREQEARIHPRAAPAQGEVQVRAGSAAGRAYPADRLAAFHPRPLAHQNRAQVEVHRDQTVAMVEKDGAAGEELILGEHYSPVRRRSHRGAGRGGVVGSRMRAARLAVEHAAGAEAAAGREIGEWRLERQGEAARRVETPQLGGARLLARDTLQVPRRGIHFRVVLDRHVLDGVGIGSDAQRAALRPAAARARDLEVARGAEIDRVEAGAADRRPARAAARAAVDAVAGPAHDHARLDRHRRRRGRGERRRERESERERYPGAAHRLKLTVPVPFAYYDRLSPRQKKIYQASY